MKRHTQPFRLMMASAIALATLVTTAIPVAQAQGEQPPPAATPIPLPEGPSEAVKVEPTAEPTAEPAAPQSTDAIIWTPASGALSINSSGQATVRVATTSGTLDPNSAKFVLIVNGIPQADQSIVGQPAGGTAYDLTATGLGPVNAATTQVLFKITLTGGGSAQESAIYSLTRSTRLGVPAMNRNSGVSTIPLAIAQTGVNPCDAITNRRGGPLGSFLRYAVNGVAGESWFWTANPNPGATIVVSLTNYTNVAGQLQVITESNGGCGGSQTLLGFGTNPNPNVVVANVPKGNLFFRVVSGDVPPGSGIRPTPPPYTIGWAFGGGGGGGGTGTEVEPNNNTCEATPLPERATYSASDNDQYDFFSIAITQSGQILMLVEGNQTVGTQIQARAPVGYNGFPEANCQPTMPAQLRKDPYTEPIGNVSSAGATVLTRSGIVINGGPNGDNAGTVSPAQTWFIRVATPNASGQSNKPYTIRWVYLPPGVTPYPFLDRMTQSGPAHGSDPLLRANTTFNDNTREKWYFSFFWANFDKIAGGVDTIQFGIDSWTLDGCPANVFPPDPTNTVPQGFAGNWVTVSNQPSGAMTWKMNKSGAYRIRFRALRNGNVVRADEKAIRVDCGFATYNFGGLWPFTTDPATPGSPVIGPEKPIDWVDPIP